MTDMPTTITEKTVRTTGPCRNLPCDRAYSGREHTVPDSGIVQHRQNWLYQPDLIQVGMVSFEDVTRGEAPGEWRAYTQLDYAAGGSEHHFAEDVVTALMRSVIGGERANARRAADGVR